MLSLSILLRRVGTREAQLDAMGREEEAQGIGVELLAIVGLQGKNRQTELCVNICKKGTDCGQNI